MQLLDFHTDDLQSFKQLLWAGENSKGLITVFPINRENVPDELKEFAKRFTEEEFNSIVSQVNQSREIVMQRVIYMNENLTEEDMPKVRGIFGKLNHENALPGEKL